MSAWNPAIGLFVAAFAVAAAPAGRQGPPEWTVREELRIGEAAGPRKLPPISRVVVRGDTAFVLTMGDEIIAFDRRRALVRRVRVISEARQTRLREQELQAFIEEMRGSHGRELPGNRERLQVDNTPQESISGHDPMRAFGWIGDTLWMLRQGTGSVALFNTRAEGIGEISYTPGLEGGPASFPLALLADRSILRTISSREASDRRRERSIPPPPDAFRMPVIPSPPGAGAEEPGRGFLVRASGDGRVLQGLEIFAEPRPPVVIRNPYGATAEVPVPFPDHPLIAVTPDGAEVVFVERYRPIRGGAASYSIARFDVASRRRSARYYPYVPVPISRLTIDSVLEGLVGRAGGKLSDRFVYGFPSLGAARAVIEAALEVPEFHTPVTDALAGADHGVWVREQGTRAWTVIGSDGAVLGRVTLPPGVRPLHVDSATAWGVIDPAPKSGEVRVLIQYRLEKR